MIVTDRCVLRRIRAEDAAVMYESWAKYEAVCRYFPFDPAADEQSYRDRVKYAAEKVRLSGTKIVMLTGPSASGKTTSAHKLAEELRDTEAALSKTSELMGAVVQYAKTRPVFDGYKAARYSRKYLAQHEAELADYRAAKTAMSELLGGAKLPKMDTLKKQHRELAEKKKALYAEYRKAQADMRQAVAVKANIDHLLGHADEQKNKAQER